MGLLMFAPQLVVPSLAQTAVIIEAPHARTIGNSETTMYYEITAKNAGTLSATVESSATGWLSAEFSGTTLRVHVAKNVSASVRYGTITITGSADASVEHAFIISQTGDEYSGAALSSFEDTKYTISTGTATSYASESPFKNSYDNNLSTSWHSNYSSGQALASGTVTATWDLGSSKSVDYVTYVPRTDGSSNGNWGAFRLQYSTNNSTWITIGNYDFGMSADASSIDFSVVTARYIRVVISSGYNNHASCAEFIIGKRNTTASSVGSEIFADDLWTTLKSSVTQATIDGISNSFVKTLAQAIFDGGYSTKYRVHTAHCYKSPDVISSEWNAPGKYYDRLGNVTGISVKRGTKIAILVPSIPTGAKLGLIIRSWYPGKKTTGDPNASGYGPLSNSYSLHEGLNVIEYNVTAPSGATEDPSDGLAYVTYFGDDDNQHADVPMHFLNGIENGYLSLDLTNDEMHNLCKNAPNQHMDVVTEHAHMVWEAQALYNYCRTTTKSSGWFSTTGTSKGYRQYIRAIEYIISSEHEALGLQK
ncbi:MAG: discoidin domain-containing protein [Alloprevotella sp.]|nr:discoidin domain-containing protein [Alloprevotella sp.]